VLSSSSSCSSTNYETWDQGLLLLPRNLAPGVSASAPAAPMESPSLSARMNVEDASASPLLLEALTLGFCFFFVFFPVAPLLLLLLLLLPLPLVTLLLVLFLVLLPLLLLFPKAALGRAFEEAEGPEGLEGGWGAVGMGVGQDDAKGFWI